METIKYKQRHLKTVSLFSGAGGLDYGFLNAGFDVIWANDFDKYAVETYKANIGEHVIQGDLFKLWEEIPSHEVLIAGFPCQPFSMMGQKLGFEDERGTLFFVIRKILEKHSTNIVVLENVKGLETHDGGKTIAKMKKILDEELDYELFTQVHNTADFGIPHNRRRIFMIGFKRTKFNNISIPFSFPKPIRTNKSVFDLLDENVDKKYFLSEKLLRTVLSHGTGGYYSKSEIDMKIARPLCATMHKMHRANQDNYYTDNINRNKFITSGEKLISNVRKLTPNECRKLQGFPSDWRQVVSDTQAYRQFGNAVTVDLAYYIAESIIDAISVFKDYSELKEESEIAI